MAPNSTLKQPYLGDTLGTQMVNTCNTRGATLLCSESEVHLCQTFPGTHNENESGLVSLSLTGSWHAPVSCTSPISTMCFVKGSDIFFVFQSSCCPTHSCKCFLTCCCISKRWTPKSTWKKTFIIRRASRIAPAHDHVLSMWVWVLFKKGGLGGGMCWSWEAHLEAIIRCVMEKPLCHGGRDSRSLGRSWGLGQHWCQSDWDGLRSWSSSKQTHRCSFTSDTLTCSKVR